MSRAAWAALIIGAVFVIGIVVLLLMPGHLRPELISRAERQSDRFGKLLASYKQDEKRLGKLIKAYPKYMNAQPEVKQVLFQMRMRKSSLDRGEKILKEVDAIIKKDRQENNHDLRVAFNKLGNLHLIESSRAKKVAAMIKDVVRVRGYRSEAAAIHKRALADAKRVATDMPPDALVDKLRALRRTNPTASGYIARRIASVPRQRQQALAIFKQHQVAFGATPKKYVRAGRQAEALHSLVVKMDSQIKSAEQSLADLDHDVDKILVDMQRAATKCAAGVCSNTHHRYKIVRDGKVTTSGWLPVKLAYYRTHEKDLGLVLSSKPRGIVDEQANHYAHPPGYNYVGRQGYGYWKHPGDPSTPPPTAGGAAPGAAAPPPGATAARPQRGGRRHPLADLAGMGDDVGAPPSDIGQPGDVWVFNAGRAPNGVCGPAQVPYNDFILYQRAQALREAYFGPGKVYGSLGRISKKCYHASAYLTEVRKQARLAAIRRRRYGGGYSGRRYGGSYGRRSGRYRSGYGYRRSYGGYGK